MAGRLSWDAIKDQYDQQWVELTDFEWEDDAPYPAAGVVGVHAGDKKEFYRALKARRKGHSGGFAVVYVGTPPRDTNEISFNLFALSRCE